MTVTEHYMGSCERYNPKYKDATNTPQFKVRVIYTANGKRGDVYCKNLRKAVRFAKSLKRLEYVKFFVFNTHLLNWYTPECWSKEYRDQVRSRDGLIAWYNPGSRIVFNRPVQTTTDAIFVTETQFLNCEIKSLKELEGRIF